MASPARIQSTIMLTLAKQVRRLSKKGMRGFLTAEEMRALALCSTTVENIRCTRAEEAQSKWNEMEAMDVEALIRDWAKKNPTKALAILDILPKGDK